MQPSKPLQSNPFVLMMAPDTVFEALARTQQLSLLPTRICRPLDKARPEQEAEDANSVITRGPARHDHVADGSAPADAAKH